MVFEKISSLVADQFGISVDDVSMQTSFVDDLSADSIDIVELMMALEEEFNIGEIEENSIEKIKTVGDIVNYIKDKID